MDMYSRIKNRMKHKKIRKKDLEAAANEAPEEGEGGEEEEDNEDDSDDDDDDDDEDDSDEESEGELHNYIDCGLGVVRIRDGYNYIFQLYLQLHQLQIFIYNCNCNNYKYICQLQSGFSQDFRIGCPNIHIWGELGVQFLFVEPTERGGGRRRDQNCVCPWRLQKLE